MSPPHIWSRQGGADQESENSPRDVTLMTRRIHGHMPDSQKL